MENKTLKQLVEEGLKLTPMMEQYWAVKTQYPDNILFFRMGDFYEMFFEDARNVARLLNISLTVRGKLGDTPIPMAGIPHHAAATYLDRLTQMGHKVIICEQLENPKEVKGLVKRGVTQIVSPAVPYDLDRSGERENNYIAASFQDATGVLLTLLDFTTGDFFGLELQTTQELVEKIQIYRPKEFLSSLGQWDHEPQIENVLTELNILHTHLSTEWFEEKHAQLYLEKLIPSYKRDGIIQTRPEILSPLSAVSWYVCSTQAMEKIQHIRPFRLIHAKDTMKVTWATLRGLEIFPREQNTWAQSLIGFMDRTKSSMGARHLKVFFQSPLKELEAILKRQEILQSLMDNQETLKLWREELTRVRDIDRILAKITTRKAHAGDLLNLANTIEVYALLERSIESKPIKKFFPLLGPDHQKQLQEIATEIKDTISDEMGAHVEKGNLIRKGVSKERDRLAKLSDSAGAELLSLEQSYREKTGITNLKVKSNNLAGFFIEVSNSHLSKVPKSFQRKQTLTNGERYTTEELSKLEVDVTSAHERLTRLEKEIFETLQNKIMRMAGLILDVSKRIAQMDVFQSLAWVSLQEGFVRPSISTEKIIEIKGAWHPLIRANIKDRFVTHNLRLTPAKPFALITGPNMAGKTTVMREVAIIQYLAQLGAWVPAAQATLGVRDYLFSRLGASDDIIRGQSTFMVEMSETAEILRHATSDSLIILDEIGRGTSTYDGLSIAWSLVEWFTSKLQSLTLFATHYHELIELADKLDNAINLTVRTEQHKGKVQFMYELIEQGATQSFGIHVAELAGLPKEVLKRARSILGNLEKNHHKQSVTELVDPDQLSLFSVTQVEATPPHLKELEKRLKDLDVMNITPLQALQMLNDLKSQTLNH
ncbi:MAG: DNA mismatch repair protein MutS [Proteobacteria bacterium]|nr:DNA mismatch repair protein MutS [Pseudomonadota bacterium]